LVGDILDRYPKEIGCEEEDDRDAMEILAVIDLVEAMAMHLTDSFPAWLDLDLLLKALDGDNEEVVQRAADGFAKLAAIPHFLPFFLESNILAYIRLCLKNNGVGTVKSAVEISANVAGAAKGVELMHLVRQGWIEVIAHGLRVDDDRIRTIGFCALTKLLRNGILNERGRNSALAECERTGVLETLAEVNPDLANTPEELEIAIRRFIAVYTELDPVGKT
jgi:hypothetical protein